MKKVFLLGDSVCIHYTVYLKEYLKNKLEIVCKPGRDEALQQINCAVGACGGDSANVLQFVREKAEKGDLDFDAFKRCLKNPPSEGFFVTVITRNGKEVLRPAEINFLKLFL